MAPMGYFRGLPLAVMVIGGLIAFDFMREGAATYKLPVAEAHNLLKSMPLPDYVFGSEPKQLEVEARDPRKIVFVVKDDGREAMRFAALLSPVNAGSTEVRVEVSGPTSGPFGNMQKRLSDHRAIRHLYVMAMKERIAATLEGREFSMVGLIPAATMATLSTVFAMAASNLLKTAPV
jgi:hypothetical protein